MHLLHRIQYLPITMEEGWEFFSDPNNLKYITPPDLEFEVVSYSGQRNLHRGQIITYTLKPLFGVRVKWVTEITQADYPDFFVDEQVDGPFAFWHHKHYLKPIDGGVKMIDSVCKLPRTSAI